MQTPHATAAPARARFVSAKLTNDIAVDEAGVLLAQCCPVNALEADAPAKFAAWFVQLLASEGAFAAASTSRATRAIIVRTGWNTQASGEGDSADTEIPLWLPTYRSAWQAFAARVESLCAEHACTPIVHPRASDVVSDTPGLLGVARNSPRWRVLLDPQALMTTSMQPQWLEHAQRYAELAEGLLTMRSLWGIVIPSQAARDAHAAPAAQLASALQKFLAKLTDDAPANATPQGQSQSQLSSQSQSIYLVTRS